MDTPPLFRDRQDAGEQLAEVVASLHPPHPIVIYALPRGGIPVAYPIAQRLAAPLTVLVAKKVAEPDNPELAIGAVTAAGDILRSREAAIELNPHLWQAALHQARQKAHSQTTQLESYCPAVSAQGAIALLVDDGIATGLTMGVAVQALQRQSPQEIWVCAPVAPSSVVQLLQSWVDRLVILAMPDPFMSVGRFYESFPQVAIEDVQALLGKQHWVGSP